MENLLEKESVKRVIKALNEFDSKFKVEVLNSSARTAVDAANFKRISVRGTLAEGNMMISRINDFDKLYFEPTGTAVLFIYKDRPGVIGQIGQSLAKAGFNIHDMRNPHDIGGDYSLALMRVSDSVDCEVIQKISNEIDAIHSSCVQF